MPGPGAQGSQAPASGASPRLSSLDSVLSHFGREAAKLGKARSVLKLLQNILKTSEKGTEQTANVHRLVPCGDVVGCLAVHVKLCKDFTSKFNVQHNTNLLLRISVNEVMKCTNPQTFKSQLKKSRKDIVIHFEDVKYFSVQVPRQQRDERNRIILELVGFQGPKDFPRLLGSATVHLYEVIKKGQFTETCAMRIGNMVFCTAEVEFMFCYGSFGYGYSHQLKYPEADLWKTLKHSMFIRIPTPEDRTDPQSNIITSQHRGYSAFLSQDMNVTEETLERNIPTTSGVPSDRLEVLQSALNKMSPRNRLEKMKKEYQSLKTWPEKAEYLDQLIMKRGPKMTTEQNMASRFKEMVGKIQHTAEEGIKSCSDTSADSELQEEQLFGIETEPREDSGLSLRITETVLRSVETDLNFVQEYEESEENLSIPTVIATSASTISQKLSAEKVPETLTRKSSEDEGTIMDSQSIISIALERETKQENSHAKEEIEDLKPAGMLSKGSDLSGLEQYPVIQIQYQQPILSGDKFEPFLRNISRMQSNTQNEKEDDQEVPIFTLLESKFSCLEIKEDQDPPFRASSAIAESSSDVNLSKNGQHLSILKLIESKMELEEGGINVEEEESPALAIRTDLPEKWQEERLSETEIVRLNSFLSNTLEDFLIDRLINIIMLKSVLSKNLEVFIAEKLSELGIVTEVELGEEFQNLQRITDGSPVFLERDLLTKRKDTFKKMLSEAEIINLKSVLSKNLQDRLIERFSETGIITNSELGKQHQYLSLQENKDRSPLVLMTDLAEKMHDSCEQRLSEMEISLKSVVTQNVQDLPIASPLETTLTEEKKLLKEHQNFSLSSTEKRQPKSDADLLKKRNDKSREKCSEPEIIIKYLSQNLQNNGTKRHSQTAIKTKMELEKEHQNHSLPITKVRLPMTMETNSPTIGQDHNKQGVSQQQINLKSASDKTLQDSLIERLLETEIMSLKDFLNKCLHDHFLEKLSETGLIMEEELETVHQNYSLMNILERHPGALETELHNVSQVNSGKSLAKPHIIKGEPVLSGPIQDFLLEVLSETEIRNLKSFLSKKIQDHLVERLSEIGLITEEELRKIHKDLFVLRANERLSRDVESDLPEEEQNLSLKSVLTKNLKDRLSETKLLQLKSLLSKILKEGHRDKLSETEIKSLKSILSNNMQDLPMECISETGLINERELEGVCQNLFLQNAKGKPLIVTDTDILQKGQFHSKQNPDKFTIINEKPILRKEKLELPVENVPEQVTCVVPNLINEAQTNSVIHLPQNNTLERESQDPQSCFDKTEVAHSQTCFDKSLKAKFPNENLKGTLETTGSPPSLNAHDIAIQTELKEYLCKPTLSFPVNPQTFIFVHSGSEEETKSPDKSHEKSKGKKKRAKRSKKHAASRYPPQGQVLMCTQFKKEKQIGLNNCKETLKEKQRKHSEPPSPRSCVSGAKKDSKHSTHTNILKKESLTQKAEQEREDGRPKKSLNKSIKIPIATVSELQLQHSAKALQEKSFNYADKKELDVEMFRHLEKAVERALCDLGKVPEVSMSQPLLSAARPHTAPIICSPTKETHRVQPASSYTTSLDSSDTDDPGNATNSESDIVESQAQQVEKASEKWAEFCKIVQRILHQNLRPQEDG